MKALRILIAICLIGLITLPATAWAGQTILMSGTIKAVDDPEEGPGAPVGALKVRIDRYGNVCLVGPGALPGCGFLNDADLPAIKAILRHGADLAKEARSQPTQGLKRLGSFLTPVPVRAGHPKRKTGIDIGMLTSASRREGYVVLKVHDARVGGGGEYFLPAKEARELASILDRVPSTSRTLDRKLKKYEAAMAERNRNEPRSDEGGSFLFRFLPLLGMFL